MVAVPGEPRAHRGRPRGRAGAVRERLGRRLVEGDEEQVGPQRGRQERLAGAGAGRRLRRAAGGAGGAGRQQGVAQRRAEALGHRRAQQEVLQRRRLALEHLLQQVLHQQGLAARGGRRGVRGRALPLERDGRQAQPGRPALGAGGHRVHGFRCGRCREGAGEEGRRLGGGEAQVGGAQLEEPAPRAQPGQRQRRVGARRDHQLQPGRGVAQQRGQQLVHPPVAHLLVVVQDRDGVVVQRREVLGQGLAQVRGGDGAGESQQAQRLPAGGGEAGPERGRQVGDEPRPVVPVVQRDPGRRPRPGGQPLAQQGGLAGAARAARAAPAAPPAGGRAGPAGGAARRRPPAGGAAAACSAAPPRPPPGGAAAAAPAPRPGVPGPGRRSRGPPRAAPRTDLQFASVHRTAPHHVPIGSPPAIQRASANAASIPPTRRSNTGWLGVWGVSAARHSRPLVRTPRGKAHCRKA